MVDNIWTPTTEQLWSHSVTKTIFRLVIKVNPIKCMHDKCPLKLSAMNSNYFCCPAQVSKIMNQCNLRPSEIIIMRSNSYHSHCCSMLTKSQTNGNSYSLNHALIDGKLWNGPTWSCCTVKCLTVYFCYNY